MLAARWHSNHVGTVVLKINNIDFIYEKFHLLSVLKLFSPYHTNEKSGFQNTRKFYMYFLEDCQVQLFCWVLNNLYGLFKHHITSKIQ